jgi:hypothetical protein
VTFLIPPIDRNLNDPNSASGIFSSSSRLSISANDANVEKIFGNALPTVIGFPVNATFVASSGSISSLNHDIVFLNHWGLGGTEIAPNRPYPGTFALGVA